MGGEKTLKKLYKIDPDINCIVSSGYSESHILAHPQDYGFKARIAKPYGKEDLARVLSKIIRENI